MAEREKNARMPELRLRQAGPADIVLLRHWDEQPHVIATHPNDDWEWEKELDGRPGLR